MATSKLAEDATQQAVMQASKLQLTLMQEQTLALSDLIREIRGLREEFKANKELIESFIAGMDSLVERMNVQVETQIKLNREEKEFLDKLERNQG